MSFSDTASAKKYAAIAEVAAAQAKLSADKLNNAPDYAEQAAASASAAASSALAASSAQSVVDSLATAASESATSAAASAASAASAGDAAAAAIGQTVRVPSGESISELPIADDRAESLVSFDASGQLVAKPISDFATLDSSGKIPVSVIPEIALTQPFVVSNQAQMLALNAQPGDIAKRTDLGYSFCLAAEPATTLSNWVQLTDDVLAQLGQSTGAASIGALDSLGSPTNVQLALNAKANVSSLAATTGAATIGTTGGGTVQSDLTARITSAQLDTAISGLASKSVLQSNVIYATADAGIANDGVTDVSTAVATFLNANKGKFIIFDSGTYLFAGVELTGTGWEGTTIYFKGKHLLTSRSSNVGNSFFGAWCGIVITSDVTRLNLYYRGDGNRINQFDEEHVFNVALCGSDNINIPYFECNEIKGDGLYVSRANPVSNGTKLPVNLTIGTIVGKNSSRDGRNLISIVSLNRGYIANVFSENIGGVVGGVTQPGGIDIEPNAGENFLVRDVTVANATVINGGTSGIAMYSGSNASPAQIQNCHYLNAILRGSGRVRMEGVKDCSVNFTADSLSSVALGVENALRTTVKGEVNGCETGALVGVRSSVSYCKIAINCANVKDAGIVTGGAGTTEFELSVSNFSSGGAGNFVGLWFRDVNAVGGFVQRNNTYKVKIPSSSGATRAIEYFTTNAISFTGENVIMPGSNFSGFTNYTSLMGNAGLYLQKSEKISGMTLASSIPTTGSWRAGDIVRNSNPSSSSLIYGWIRMVGGVGNVAGIDWGVLKFTTS